MSDLSTVFASLVRYHVATQACPLPERAPAGITWVWAANGVYKRGVGADLDLLIRCGKAWQAPGLVQLLPHARWQRGPARLPGALLAPLLSDAQRASSGGVVALPIEKQYFFVERDGLRVVAPRIQDGSAGRVRYSMPLSGRILLDLHSHHAMHAYFSQTDDRDDTGLSVSAVIGQIYTCPTILVRLNVFGDHLEVPALTIFDSLGPFHDGYRGGTADADLND